MSVQKIHLRKLLQLMGLSTSKRRGKLREDIRNDLKKEEGPTDGGDFHIPFWTDAKLHVAGKVDLAEQTNIRIKAHRGRARLYPELRDGFLSWWNEKRRWKNAPFSFLPTSPKAQYVSPGLGIVKIENLLGLQIGDTDRRAIYAYFSEEPELSDELARIGLWVMNQALPNLDPTELRILDVLRSRSLGIADVPFVGNEEATFNARYKEILKEWEELKEEY